MIYHRRQPSQLLLRHRPGPLGGFDERNRHHQHSMVTLPMDTPGVEVARNIPILQHQSPEGIASLPSGVCGYRRSTCWERAVRALP